MEEISCRVVHEDDWNELQRYTGRLQGRVKVLRRDRNILFFLFLIISLALAYLISNPGL